jgi:hypothetical protein
MPTSEEQTPQAAPKLRIRSTSRWRHLLGASLLLPIVFLAASAGAQSLGSAPGYIDYLSLLGTPVASLPPLATYTLFGVAQRSPQLVARYGYVSDMAQPLAPPSGGHEAHSLGSFGLTGVIPVGLDGTVALTAGLANQRCTGCSGSAFMAAISGDHRLTTLSIDAASASRLTIAANGEIGVGHPAPGVTWSADVGLPLALALGPTTGTSIIPFVTPSIAGFITHDASGNSRGAVRLLVGAGVGLFNPKSALGASAGFQYVFVDKTQLQFGITLSLGGR